MGQRLGNAVSILWNKLWVLLFVHSGMLCDLGSLTLWWAYFSGELGEFLKAIAV